ATPVSCRARAHPLIRGQRFDNIHATRRRETSSAGFPTREGGQPMAYTLEGQLLEVCTCNILCPCWVGEDPDGGTCDGVLSCHIKSGAVNGTDVSGRTFTILTHIPGNILDGNWKIVAYVDDGASDEQQQALLDVWTGKLGGPIADLAQLVGEVKAVERAPV